MMSNMGALGVSPDDPIDILATEAFSMADEALNPEYPWNNDEVPLGLVWALAEALIRNEEI